MPEGGLAASDPLMMLLAAACLFAVSGVPCLILSRRSRWGQRIAAGLIVLGSSLGLGGGCLAIRGGQAAVLTVPSPFPGVGAELAADPLSGFFALPVFVVGALGAIFGLSYWTPARHPRHGRRLHLSYGLLLASLTLVTIARDTMIFLVAWEIMTLTNFLLVTTEEESASVRQAGWLYLLYSHVTILCLFALFLLQGELTGGFAYAVIPQSVESASLRTAVFTLAVIAFGIKAGAMPFHSWLPAAHASAPSHVSALMSGVVIKMGIYGLIRTCGLLASPPLTWGIALLVLGSITAFFGVVFALAQHDVKRLLAYHSIENIGIILLGLGLAMVGRSSGRPDWVMLGLAGALLHVWNHALFKSLLFFGAGSVVHATGTRNLELTGGLARRMPATATFFLLGAIAICGLPPLNGFVSELLVYLGLARAATAPGAAWVALPAPVLAATGALAVACFVKVFGVVFLGVPRSAAAGKAHESPRLMLAPMAILALGCVAIGTAPGLVAPALESAVSAWTSDPLPPIPPLAQVAPLGWISGAAAVLLAAAGLLVAAVAGPSLRARRRQPGLPTWDCGYAVSSPRLQYTASSFAQLITSRFAWALRPEVHKPSTKELFPVPDRFHSHVEDSVLEGVLRPAARAAMRFATTARALPEGLLQRYILYILGAVVLLLAWAIVGGEAPA